MRKVLIGLLFLGLSSAYAQQRPAQFAGAVAPSDGKIKGQVVTGQDNKPLEYASVGVYRMNDSSLVTGTLTDPKGSFSFDNIPFGRYYLEVNYVGFKKSRIRNISITPQSKEANIGNISIVESITNVAEVEVVAQKSQVEYKLDKKVVNVSSNIVASGGTAVDALQNVPSVQTDVDGNVQLRGSSNFTVLINGKPSVLQGSEALQQIPASTIDNIEIITNPSAKYDPDGVAGIINVVLKKQKFAGISGVINASVASRPQYSSDILLNYRTNKVNFVVGADWMNMQMPGTMKMNQKSFLGGDTVRYLDNVADNVMTRKGYGFKGGFSLNINDNNSLSINGNYGNRAFDRSSDTRYHDYILPSNYNMYYIKINNGNSTRDYYSLNTDYTHIFSEKGHELDASVYYSYGINQNLSDFWQLPSDPNYKIIDPLAAYSIVRTGTQTSQNDLRTKIDYVKTFNEKSKFEAGYQGRYNTTKDTFSLLSYDPDTRKWTNDMNSFEIVHFVDNIQAMYAMYSGSLPFIDYQLGLRGEYNNRKLTRVLVDSAYTINRLDLFPTIHLSKKLPNDQQIQLSYSRRVERPDERQLDPFRQFMDSLHYQIGNPKLNPEFTDSYELNFQKRKGSSVYSAEFYFRQTNDLIERWTDLMPNQVFRYTSKNVGKDQSLGLELMTNLDVTKWWNLNLTATGYYYRLIVKGTNRDSTFNTYTGNIRMNSTFSLKTGTRIQLNAFYNAPSIEAQGTEGHMFMTNLGIRQDFFKHKLSATLQVRDMFNTMRRTGTANGPGFYSANEFHRNGPTFILSLSYKFNNFKQERKRQEEVDQRDFDNGEVL